MQEDLRLGANCPRPNAEASDGDGAHARMQPESANITRPEITAFDRVLGTSVLVALVSTIAFAKTSVVTLALLALVVACAAILERKRQPIRFTLGLSSALVLAFLLWALLSSAWAPDAEDAIVSVVRALATIAAGYLVLVWLEWQPARRVKHFAFWIVVGYIAAGGVLLAALLLKQAPIAWIIETAGLYAPGESSKLVEEARDGGLRVRAAMMNGSVAALNLLLIPMLVIIWTSLSGWRRYGLAALLLALAYATTFVSTHETSKVALVVAPLVFLAALWQRRATTVVIAATWTAAVMLSVPLSLAAYHGLKLSEASWLQHSARDRVAIWAEFAERFKDAPLHGAGLRAAKYLNETNTPSIVPRPKRTNSGVSRHPHNVYLQTSFELGLIGSVLMLSAGLALLMHTRKTRTPSPAMLTLLAAGALYLALCWDLWQPWYIAMYMVVAVMMMIAERQSEIARPPRREANPAEA